MYLETPLARHRAVIYCEKSSMYSGKSPKYSEKIPMYLETRGSPLCGSLWYIGLFSIVHRALFDSTWGSFR